MPTVLFSTKETPFPLTVLVMIMLGLSGIWLAFL